ncbi:MAG: choice-of-anchor J domain-containing protein [Cyclobacteriaceae bacterium]|nr:choice-of-anchor J domain-containing protein [Cyclobacteriaceae bacterium]
MLKPKVYIILFVVMLFISKITVAQRTCGTMEYMNQLGNTESKVALENWIKEKQLEPPSTGLKSFNADGVTVYQIPVVVHIIHNGEAIGAGTNISDAQILSQIEVLNEDFRKLNADSVNIPAEFKPFYSDIGFEFVMAKRDPNSQATNGITRTQGSKTVWGMTDDVILKSQSYWPSEDYFNIWIAPLSGGFLGWAQFPQSDQLNGLEPPYNATTDGVVITYNAFGSIDKEPTANLQSRFNLGRTTTHEIAHFFGLRHIWGDGGCGVDDYVDDTPSADTEYYNCPTMGGGTTSCNTQDMYMNFMDYVDDVCMNMFSAGQKDRMVIIMENSPRRLSLTNSPGLLPPNSEDLALIKFISPTIGICNEQLTLIIEVKNVGVLPLTSTNISVFINNSLIANQNFNFNLAASQSAELTFNPITLNAFGNIEFKAEINSINGLPDNFVETNILTQMSLRAETVSTLYENFSSDNPQWTVRTSEESSALDKKQAVSYSINNNSAVFNYYKTETSSDAYISPKLALDATPQVLIFDYAYAYRNLEDELAVTISTDCGNTFNEVLFSAKGAQLATSAAIPVAFYPTGAQDWQHAQINLSSYANQEVLFSFSGNSKGGNQIFIDNIKVVDNSYNDIALAGLTSPAINCSQQNEVILWVENKGLNELTDLSVETILGSITSTINYTQLNLLPGERIDLVLPTPEFEETAELLVSLANDDNNSNNSFTQTIIAPTALMSVPLREKFESTSLPKNWILSGNLQSPNSRWKLANNRLEFIAANSNAKGLKEQIILPPLNLSDLSSASMHFNFAYAFNGSNEELLQIKATKDCGQSFETLFIEGGEDLATNFTTTPWLPNADSDWKNVYINLTDFAGNENVQLVIELTSAQGNNAFIKNIELYASNITNPLNLVENSITAYPNPSTNGLVNISFNLTEQQPAKLLIYNAQGSFIYEKNIENALNQTFEVATAHLQSGIYFARLVGTQIDISRSFIISQ